MFEMITKCGHHRQKNTAVLNARHIGHLGEMQLIRTLLVTRHKRC